VRALFFGSDGVAFTVAGGGVLGRFGRLILVVAVGGGLAACGSVPRSRGTADPTKSAPVPGAYYQDDGPEAVAPPNLDAVLEAVPRDEPLLVHANRPYTVMGVSYTPQTHPPTYRARGTASWYGKKFHGRRTSSGERYDMYAMTAAHPTLPIPSYVRVTHLGNGRSVVVRVNDRGPFLHRRLIDLSYAAAHKLGYISMGTAPVEVERVFPNDDSVPATLAAAARALKPAKAAAPSADQHAANPSEWTQSFERAIAPRPVLSPWPMQADSGTKAVSSEARLSFELLSQEPMAGPALPRPDAAATESPGALATASKTPIKAVAPAEPDASPAAAAPATPEVWLQLGAFGSRQNAERALRQVQDEAAHHGVGVSVVQSGGLWRVQMGPWPHRAQASVMAEQIASEGLFKPVPVVR
jgi:rare lipoprotein A